MGWRSRRAGRTDHFQSVKSRHLRAIRTHFGTSWLARRALYALKLRSGSLKRRLPLTTWNDQELAGFLSNQQLADPDAYFDHRINHSPKFFFSSEQRHAYEPILKQWDDGSGSPTVLANRIQDGTFRFFEHDDLNLGMPPNWHANTATGQRFPEQRHWSEISDFGCGDIKLIWEPSRFGFTYSLVRAYWRTGNERYPELFWELVESWRESNQPQQGANWKCGQEASFRAMAWSFGLYGFLKAAATTARRITELAQMLATTAYRIEANIDYAISQSNNHGISEGVGLWTIGLLFPEFAHAKRWRDRGRAVLEKEGLRLIYEDGAFSQHSVNYQRLMLHDYVWSLRLGEVHGVSFSDELKARVQRAGEFLFQLQDEKTGAVPLYGQNDGALILPLNNCGYHDFRPIVGAIHYLAQGENRFENGPWQEDLLWLFGPDALAAPVRANRRHDFRADYGGYYTLRATDSFVFTRCGGFRHRPSQADMLHVDLWWRGHNIALDAGTYSYNSAEPWADAFSGTASHNTVTVDNLDQMERAGKFLWLPWLIGRLDFLKRQAQLACLEGSHDGYLRLNLGVVHRRAVAQLGPESWLVIDGLFARDKHSYRLQWLLADLPHEFDPDKQRVSLTTVEGPYHICCGTISGGATSSLVRADPESARGWRAPFYNYREPALSLALTETASSTIFWTLFSPQACVIHVQETGIQIRGEEVSFDVEISGVTEQPLILAIRSQSEQLIVTK